MFYNGTKQLVVLLFFKSIIIFNFFNILMYKVFTEYNKFGVNDSMEFIGLISSSVYTLFIFVVLTITTGLLVSYRYFYKCIFTIFIYTYYLSAYDYVGALQNIFKTSTITLTLQNGLLNIHPYIIYIAYSWIFLYVINKIIQTKCFIKELYNMVNINKLIYLVFFGIILGAWWASQELNWGGFWSWDPVELISILIFFYIIKIQHDILYMFRTIHIISYIAVFTVIYLIMRVGVVATIHSFIKSTTIPSYVYILYLLNTILVSCVVYNHITTSTSISSSVYWLVIIFIFYTLILSLYVLIGTNFNILTFYTLIPLDTIYSIILYVFLFIVIIKNKLFSMKLLVYSTITIYITIAFNINMLNIGYILLMYIIFKRISNLIVHSTLVWVYMIFLYFFLNINTYHECILMYGSNINITNFYDNLNCNDLYLCKTFFLIDNKNFIHHVLNFFIHSNSILSNFFIVRNKQVHLLYNEEFIFVNIALIIFTIFFINKKKNSNIICYY